MSQARTDNRTPASLVVLLLGMVAAGSAAPRVAAEEAGAAVLRPYKATYETSYRGMKLQLDRELKAEGDGRYTLTNGGKILVAGVQEVSVFEVEGTRVVPKSYIHQGTGLNNRRREVHFTPGAKTIRSLYKDKWYDLPYTENTLDRMSQQEQLRLNLLNDPTPREDINFRVADGKRVKDYQFVYVGEETVKTPLGTVNTLHFERPHDDPDRKSDTWIAPEWDFMMVKTVHIEDGRPVEAMITSAVIDGEAVAAAQSQ
jgi:hypothetical protein